MMGESEHFQDVVEDRLFFLRCAVRHSPRCANSGHIFCKYGGVYIISILKQLHPAFFCRGVLAGAERSLVQRPKICRPQLGLDEYLATAFTLRTFDVSNETVDLVEVCHNQV